MELLTRSGLAFGLRWLHVLGGITWIGLLYYFNLVQVPAFAAFGDEGKARNIAIDQIARRALWWFRWAALFTLVTGLFIIGATENYMKGFLQSYGFIYGDCERVYCCTAVHVSCTAVLLHVRLD